MTNNKMSSQEDVKKMNLEGKKGKPQGGKPLAPNYPPPPPPPPPPPKKK